MERVRLHGVFTTLVTPFNAERGVDEVALRTLVDRQIEAGVQGIVACGLTGEGPALSPIEHERVVGMVVDQAAGRATVLAAAAANNTRLAIELAFRCEDAGADALMPITPGYIQPNQAGLSRYYEQILTATKSPMVLYNVPSRTGSTLQPQTILQLAQHPRVMSVKQGVPDLAQLNQILASRPPSFSVMCGDDAWILGMIATGADGVISVTANAYPAALVELVKMALLGDRQTAIELHRQLVPMVSAMSSETNPMPIKFVLTEMGLIENVLRDPLAPMTEALEPLLIEAIEGIQRTESATAKLMSVHPR